MLNNIRITFLEPISVEGVAAMVQKEVVKLERVCEMEGSCHVVVDRPNHRRKKGDRYRVQVAVGPAGRSVIAGSDPTAASRNENLHVALSNAFRAARRMLKQRRERLRDRRRHGNVQVAAQEAV